MTMAGRQGWSCCRPGGRVGVQPTLECARADDSHAEEHLGVVQPAVGGAVAGENTLLDRREVKPVPHAWQGLATEVERRDIKRVHDVVGDERYLGRLSERQLEARVLRGKRASRQERRPWLRG